MKTNINKYIGLVLLLIVVASCSDNFLEDKKNYGEYDDTFYQTPERVTAYVNGLYYRYFYTLTSAQVTMTGAYTTDRSRLTEEIGGVQSLTNPNLNFDDPSNTSVLGFTGYYGTKLSDKVKNEPYDRIRDCNSMLENIDSKGANLDQTFRDQVKGQMYYLRAIQYFDLMRVYGGVPIVTTVENASATDLSVRHPRGTVGEVVAQIVKDLDMAASLLPGKWPNAATDYGRFTKGAALAQKSRV
uniref:RagB/SusD family nutrient uptake outer membrane protein n=1 Tax=Flavobacterium alvei TaxID=2080416 RepID=UPI0026EB3C5B